MAYKLTNKQLIKFNQLAQKNTRKTTINLKLESATKTQKKKKISGGNVGSRIYVPKPIIIKKAKIKKGGRKALFDRLLKEKNNARGNLDSWIQANYNFNKHFRSKELAEIWNDTLIHNRRLARALKKQTKARKSHTVSADEFVDYLKSFGGEIKEMAQGKSWGYVIQIGNEWIASSDPIGIEKLLSEMENKKGD